jgi:hypothetical protein
MKMMTVLQYTRLEKPHPPVKGDPGKSMYAVRVWIEGLANGW